MGNPESESFQAIVSAFLQQETAEHVEHWYDNEALKTVSAQIPVGKELMGNVRHHNSYSHLLEFRRLSGEQVHSKTSEGQQDVVATGN